MIHIYSLQQGSLTTNRYYIYIYMILITTTFQHRAIHTTQIAPNMLQLAENRSQPKAQFLCIYIILRLTSSTVPLFQPVSPLTMLHTTTRRGLCSSPTLQWRQHGHDGVLNHQPLDCLLNRLFGCRSKKTSKLRVTGLCVGKSPLTAEFPAQRASNAENASIWWRHHNNRQNRNYMYDHYTHTDELICQWHSPSLAKKWFVDT